MVRLLKRVAGKLPVNSQQWLKKVHFAWQQRAGTFSADEPEFDRLQEWVQPGDCVLDIGANVGHYTRRLSELVGCDGRVIGFEPVPATFELLVASASRFPFNNHTLLNVAASDQAKLRRMELPQSDTGLTNYYMARLVEGEGELSVLSLSIDALGLPGPIRFAKIDAEGHEFEVLKGMERLIDRDLPTLVIEGRSEQVASALTVLGYRFEQSPNSPNRVFTPPSRTPKPQTPHR